MPGLSLGLGLGLTMQRGGAHPPTTQSILYQAIEKKRAVTFHFSAAEHQHTIEPYVVYELDGKLFVDGVLVRDDHPRDSLPLPLTTFPVADMSKVKLTDRPFAVDPFFTSIVGKYQNVKRIVEIE
jgi:hypothetical protein